MTFLRFAGQLNGQWKAGEMGEGVAVEKESTGEEWTSNKFVKIDLPRSPIGEGSIEGPIPQSPNLFQYIHRKLEKHPSACLYQSGIGTIGPTEAQYS